MNHTYRSLRKEADSMGERNDCVVKAIAVVTGLPYKEVHAACRTQGRRNRDGMWRPDWMAVVERLGYQLVDRTEEARSRGGLTTRSIAGVLPTRPFLIRTVRHLSGWNGTRIVDWANHKLKRVRQVLEVVPSGQPVPDFAASIPVGVKVRAPQRQVGFLGYNAEDKAIELLLDSPDDDGVTVELLAAALETNEKGARNMIDRLRRKGYRVRNVGRGRFTML